jgi:hypothetical protein
LRSGASKRQKGRKRADTIGHRFTKKLLAKVKGRKMSGGYFDYAQHYINDIADSVDRLIKNNDYEFSADTIDKLKKGSKQLKLAYIYAHRIDWLISGDDGDESFLKRLEEELEALSSEE